MIDDQKKEKYKEIIVENVNESVLDVQKQEIQLFLFRRNRKKIILQYIIKFFDISNKEKIL